MSHISHAAALTELIETFTRPSHPNYGYNKFEKLEKISEFGSHFTDNDDILTIEEIFDRTIKIANKASRERKIIIKVGNTPESFFVFLINPSTTVDAFITGIKHELNLE